MYVDRRTGPGGNLKTYTSDQRNRLRSETPSSAARKAVRPDGPDQQVTFVRQKSGLEHVSGKRSDKAVRQARQANIRNLERKYVVTRVPYPTQKPAGYKGKKFVPGPRVFTPKTGPNKGQELEFAFKKTAKLVSVKPIAPLKKVTYKQRRRAGRVPAASTAVADPDATEDEAPAKRSRKSK